MDDLIRREAAIKNHCRFCIACSICNRNGACLSAEIEALKAIPAVEEVNEKRVSMALETSPGNRIRSMSNYELAEFLSNVVDHCFTLGMNQKTEAFPCDTDCAMYECCCGPYMSVEQWLEGTTDKELEEYFQRVDCASMGKERIEVLEKRLVEQNEEVHHD